MYFIKFLIQLSMFLIWINDSSQQDTLSSRDKKKLLADNVQDSMGLGSLVTDDPYDAEDKTNPTNLDYILNIDTGRYTVMEYNYHNQQNTYVTANYARETNDTCIDSYIACLITGTTRTPVCVTNDIAYIQSTMTYMSYCDMYFDNCRRGYRVWRVIAQGFCFWNRNGEKKIYDFHTNTFVSDYELKIRMKGQQG